MEKEFLGIKRRDKERAITHFEQVKRQAASIPEIKDEAIRNALYDFVGEISKHCDDAKDLSQS